MLTGIILFIVLILFAIFFIISKRKMLISLFSMQADVPGTKLQAELQHTADDIIGGLEEKIVQLEGLLREADRKIDILSQQLAKIEKAQNTGTFLSEKKKVPVNAVPPKQHVDIIDQPDTNDFAKQLIAAADHIDKKASLYTAPNRDDAIQQSAENSGMMQDENVEQVNTTEQLTNHHKHSLILTMAEQGYSPVEIAKATGAGKGEILLLLQLNKK